MTEEQERWGARKNAPEAHAHDAATEAHGYRTGGENAPARQNYMVITVHHSYRLAKVGANGARSRLTSQALVVASAIALLAGAALFGSALAFENGAAALRAATPIVSEAQLEKMDQDARAIYQTADSMRKVQGLNQINAVMPRVVPTSP